MNPEPSCSYTLCGVIHDMLSKGFCTFCCRVAEEAPEGDEAHQRVTNMADNVVDQVGILYGSLCQLDVMGCLLVSSCGMTGTCNKACMGHLPLVCFLPVVWAMHWIQFADLQ